MQIGHQDVRHSGALLPEGDNVLGVDFNTKHTVIAFIIHAMIILQSGIYKSGNYWLYQVIHHSLEQAGMPQRSYARQHPIYQQAKDWPYFSDQAGVDYIEITNRGHYFRKGAYVEPIPDLDAFLAQCTHVWTHSFWSGGTNSAFGKFNKIVYIIRDPRDVVTSAARFVFTPFMQQEHPLQERNPQEYLQHRLYELLLGWVQHVGSYLLKHREYPIHFVFYERLLANFDESYGELLDFLEINLPPASRAAVKQATQFNEMKKKSPHHVHKGQARQWLETLTPTQSSVATQIAGPLLGLLNYPIDPRAAEEASLPWLPGDLEVESIQDALQDSRGTWRDQLRYAVAYLRSRRPLAEKLNRGLEYIGGSGRWKI
jgi:aryl sulfotransferase